MEKLIEALKPFAAYAELSGSKYVPDDFQISQGSKFAGRQLTMADCRKASQVLKELSKV